MKILKFLLMAFLCLLMVVLAVGCSTSAKEATEEVAELPDLTGRWTLTSYALDTVAAAFDDADYALTFNEAEHFFGITTDCNSIGGGFEMVSDTIRLFNPMVTEMACDDMTVEQAMLQLVNDPAVYAIAAGDTLTLTAPQVGTATFVKTPGE